MNKNKNKVFPSIRDVFNTVGCHSTLFFKNCGLTTFQKLFKPMGYKYYDSRQIIRKELMDKYENNNKRVKYLIEKRKIEKSSPKSQFYYLDETWIHKNYVKYKILQPLNNSKKLRFKIGIGKGTRYSIIH
jgi:hypothetical protein